MTYRNSASFGKRQEYIAIAELLKRGYDVHMPLVDDMQIDCVVRLDRPKPLYLDIQIKARSKESKNPAFYPHLKIENPRPNYFFILISEAANQFWVIPSLIIVKEALKLKSGAHAGKYSLTLAARHSSGEVVPRQKFDEYRNNFNLLDKFKG